MRRHPSTRPLLPAALLAVSLLLGACGSPAPDDRARLDEAPPTTEATPVTTVAPAPTEAEAAPPVATIARPAGALVALAEPAGDADVVALLPATTGFGSPRALLVVDRAPGWVRVQLPVRPNGTTGWVPEDAVELTAGRHRVTVDLATQQLTVHEDDAVLLTTPVAVGAPEAPTPTGTFAIVDRLQAPDPSGPYGPFALGLGGFSETFSEFAGGNGQIGIHGTDDPTSIGRAVSHGCIRVPNDVVARLADLLPLGTPVTVA
jgi:lipoprotein-anchoring transpeptidase ErfK/SrfK